MSFKKYGFTLAEVLITLGIIGVVAAMSLPALMTKIRERQTITRLQTTYSILSQALKLAEEESGGVTAELQGKINAQEAKIIAEKLKPHLKILNDCGTEAGADNTCVANMHYKKSGSSHVNYNVNTKYYKVVLMNGTSLWWRSFASGEFNDNGSGINFFVDTNGVLPPNTWGKDLFGFLYFNGTLVPEGAPDTRYLYTTDCISKTSTGYGCAYYVLTYKNMDYLH